MVVASLDRRNIDSEIFTARLLNEEKEKARKEGRRGDIQRQQNINSIRGERTIRTLKQSARNYFIQQGQAAAIIREEAGFFSRLSFAHTMSAAGFVALLFTAILKDSTDFATMITGGFFGSFVNIFIFFITKIILHLRKIEVRTHIRNIYRIIWIIELIPGLNFAPTYIVGLLYGAFILKRKENHNKDKSKNLEKEAVKYQRKYA